MTDHRFELVQDVGVEDVLSIAFLCEIVFEGLDPCVMDGLGESSGSAEDLDKERARDQFEATRDCQDVSVVWCGICSGRSRSMPTPNTDVFRKL